MGIHDRPTLHCRDCGAELDLGIWFGNGDVRDVAAIIGDMEEAVSDRGSKVFVRTKPGACHGCGGGRIVSDPHND